MENSIAEPFYMMIYFRQKMESIDDTIRVLRTYINELSNPAEKREYIQKNLNNVFDVLSAVKTNDGQILDKYHDNSSLKWWGKIGRFYFDELKKVTMVRPLRKYGLIERLNKAFLDGNQEPEPVHSTSFAYSK